MTNEKKENNVSEVDTNQVEVPRVEQVKSTVAASHLYPKGDDYGTEVVRTADSEIKDAVVEQPTKSVGAINEIGDRVIAPKSKRASAFGEHSQKSTSPKPEKRKPMKKKHLNLPVTIDHVQDDGKTHVRIGWGGKTRLGRRFSLWGKCPFVDKHFGHFNCVGLFITQALINRTDIPDMGFHGMGAIARKDSLYTNFPHAKEVFYGDRGLVIALGTWAFYSMVMSDPALQKEIKNNKLPFDSYRVDKTHDGQVSNIIRRRREELIQVEMLSRVQYAILNNKDPKNPIELGMLPPAKEPIGEVKLAKSHDRNRNRNNPRGLTNRPMAGLKDLMSKE